MDNERTISKEEQQFLDTYNPKDYERPSVTSDIILFTILNKKLKVLLVRRGGYPFKGYWAIPGGFVDIDESCDDAAYRELQEETNVKQVYLEQLGTFSQPDRDPRMRVISVAYMALVSPEQLPAHIVAGDDAIKVKWFEVNKLLDNKVNLAFDHSAILNTAIQRLRGKLFYTNIAFNLVNENFTFAQLANVFEEIQNKSVHESNLKRDLKMKIIPTGRHVKTKSRPAELYRQNKNCSENGGEQT